MYTRTFIEYGTRISNGQKMWYSGTNSSEFGNYRHSIPIKQAFFASAFAAWTPQFIQQPSLSTWVGMISKDDEEKLIHSKPMTMISCVNGQPYHLEHRDTSISTGFLIPNEGDNYIPPLDSYSCGDDAALSLSKILCVADGVGGWHSTPGGNPALYSRTLCHNIVQKIKGILSSYFYLQDDQLYDLIHTSHQSIDQVMGSTTLALAIVNQSTTSTPEWLLYNLGDSGIFIIREGQVIYRSKTLCHGFNCPFQLGSRSKDTARDGEITRVIAKPGDFALLSTDGLLDNVSDQEILSIVNQHMEQRVESSPSPEKSLFLYKSLHDMTKHLVRVACNRFSDKNGTGYLDGRFKGAAKPDDVTVAAGILMYE